MSDTTDLPIDEILAYVRALNEETRATRTYMREFARVSRNVVDASSALMWAIDAIRDQAGPDDPQIKRLVELSRHVGSQVVIREMNELDTQDPMAGATPETARPGPPRARALQSPRPWSEIRPDTTTTREDNPT